MENVKPTVAVPYDAKALFEKFKKRGLNLAEDELKVAIEETATWLEESAKLSVTPYDDIALSVLPLLKKAGLDLADKLDGEVG